MKIQTNADLSKDQENQKYNRIKKSLPKLAVASLAIALAVYFSSPWLIVLFASAAVLLIVSAIMERSAETEKPTHFKLLYTKP